LLSGSLKELLGIITKVNGSICLLINYEEAERACIDKLIEIVKNK
jgi:hypothetical protein